MGIGMVVWGLASVIIGEALVGARHVGFVDHRRRHGSVLFRLLVAMALRGGLNPNDLKLITAAFVFVALVLPTALRPKPAQRPRPARRADAAMLEIRRHPQDVHRRHAQRGPGPAGRRPRRSSRGRSSIVIGTNGSGKSTLLNAVAGTFLVDAGRIRDRRRGRDTAGPSTGGPR